MKINDNSFIKTSKKKYNKKPIKSIAEYMDYINFIIYRWKEPELWYRGVTSHKFDLIPNIYRKSSWKFDSDLELEINDTFIHRAKSYLENSATFGKWEWYQIMQHYKAPTRLLDWTEGYLIALYFALNEDRNKTSPAVWVLNPYNLNEIVQELYTIFYTDTLTKDNFDEVVEKYRFHYNELPNYPIAILPPYTNKRMTAQKSCFTIHGKEFNGFEKIFGKNKDFNLIQLIIDKSRNNVVKIKNELYECGITEATIFPDLEGLARELKFIYNIK